MSNDTSTPPLSRRWRGRAAVAAAIAAAFLLGMCLGTSPHAGHEHTAGDAAEEVWTCPMHPQIRQGVPGRCPICGMELVRVTGAAAASAGNHAPHIELSERAHTLARVRTSEVKPMDAAGHALRLLGRVDHDETRLVAVTAWTGGRIDRLLVSTTGQHIRAGQIIAHLYSPEIYAAHSDLIQAARQVTRLEKSSELAQSGARAALDAARQRLRLLGVPDRELDTMQAADAPARSVPIRTPAGGTVIERMVNQGSYVSAGTALYRVTDLSRVWVQLDAYETDVSLLSVGDAVTLEVTGVPGERFEGTVAFLDPVVDARRRTSRVRVEVENPRGLLRPGMFAEAVIAAGARGAGQLMIPDTAPLFTGQRSLVYVELAGAERPAYEPREVTLGPRAGRFYPVLSGLEPGERVVTRGAFVIDADLQIQGGPSMMTRDDDPSRQQREALAALPEPLAQELAGLVTAYLGAQEALAADDLGRARAASQKIGQAVQAVSAIMPEALSPHWDDLATPLGAAARDLAGADAMLPARQSFEALSNQVVLLLERFGNPTDMTINLAHCPMAFDGRGATWVQRDDTLANAYFGASMLTCGEVRARVQPGQSTDSATPAPAGHVH